MGSAYDTIQFDRARCDGCGECAAACARVKGGASRITVVEESATHGFGVALCRQCGDPKCVKVCPAGALAKNATSGVVDWDGERCVDCLLCLAGCAFAGIATAPSDDGGASRVAKCDLCDGDPACVKACKAGALQLNRSARLYNDYGDREDLFVPGLAGCQGCNSELIMRHVMRRIGRNAVLATPPGCIPGMGSVGFNGKAGTKVPVFHPLLTNTASMLTGIRRHYDRLGRKDIVVVALAGDGGTSDCGFASLSGAVERNERILFICVDNEGYMNTGMQRSGTTPFGSWTSTTPVGKVSRGKSQDAKNLPLIIAAHKARYVATASTGHIEDLYEKLDQAIDASFEGFAYLHVYSPCPTGWRTQTHDVIKVARMSVDCNFVNLWEYTPATGLRLTHPTDDPVPLRDYLELLGKFRHLDDDQLAHIQAKVDEQVALLNGMASA